MRAKKAETMCFCTDLRLFYVSRDLPHGITGMQHQCRPPSRNVAQVPACQSEKRLKQKVIGERHLACRASLLSEPGSIRHCPFHKLTYACSAPTMPRISFRGAGCSEEILTESRSFSSPAASFSSSEAYSTATVSPCLTGSPVFFRNSIPAA